MVGVLHRPYDWQ